MKQMNFKSLYTACLMAIVLCSSTCGGVNHSLGMKGTEGKNNNNASGAPQVQIDLKKFGQKLGRQSESLEAAIKEIERKRFSRAGELLQILQDIKKGIPVDRNKVCGSGPENLMLLACENNCPCTIEFFLKKGVQNKHEVFFSVKDVIRVNDNATPLHVVAERGYLECVNVILGKRYSKELDMGAQKTSNGNTPLHDAINGRHRECVEALLQAGSPIEIKNDAGMGAYAFARERNDTRIVRAIGKYQDNVCCVVQ